MKTILMLDEMPKSCEECPFFENEDVRSCLAYMDFKAHTIILQKVGEEKASFCPLKPMPEELPTPYMTRQIMIASGIQTEKPPYTEEYQKGYNDCIKEIIGEE